MEEVKTEKKKVSSSMHEGTLAFAWVVMVIGVIPALSQEINNLYAAPIISFAILLFMYSKLIGVLEQIRDNIKGGYK